MQPVSIICTVYSGSVRLRASARMYLHGALWRLEFILNRCFFSSSPRCVCYVYDKFFALTPRVGREQGCLWSDKLHIRALFNIPHMATSDELFKMSNRGTATEAPLHAKMLKAHEGWGGKKECEKRIFI